MEFKKHSTNAVAELLIHLADKEKFESVKGLNDFSRSDVATILREISAGLKQQTASEPLIKRQSLSNRDMTASIHHVITSLTPNEEETLLKSFKIG